MNNTLQFIVWKRIVMIFKAGSLTHVIIIPDFSSYQHSLDADECATYRPTPGSPTNTTKAVTARFSRKKQDQDQLQ